MRRLTAAALAGLLLPPLGCGDSDPDTARERPVRARVERLYAAAAAQDGRAICRQLAPAWRARLDRRPPACPVEALRVVLGPGPPRNLRLGRVEVDGARARVTASAVRGHGAAERTYRRRIELSRAGAGWRVARTSAEER